jgi:hypothetical protein
MYIYTMASYRTRIKPRPKIPQPTRTSQDYTYIISYIIYNVIFLHVKNIHIILGHLGRQLPPAQVAPAGLVPAPACPRARE